MRISISFEDDQLDLDLRDDQLASAWNGPPALTLDALNLSLLAALERPADRPSLPRSVVPGDRVVLPLDPTAPLLGPILSQILTLLVQAGVEPRDVLLLPTAPLPPGLEASLPPEVQVQVHDPADRPSLAYLAATSEGEPVYLNRAATDADVLLPIGLLRHRYQLPIAGPATVLYPGLADQKARRRPGDDAPEVNWLIGSPLQIGLVPAHPGGIAAVLAGTEAKVIELGKRAFQRGWTIRANPVADLVIAGVGAPDEPATLGQVVDAIVTGARLVDRGGRVAVLSHIAGPLGPAMQRLLGLDEAARAPTLRRARNADDLPLAKLLAKAMARCRVYLHSKLDPDLVEELGLVPLERPEEARRLAAAAESIVAISRADLFRVTRPKVEDADDDE